MQRLFFAAIMAALLSSCDCSAEAMDALPDGGLSAPYCANECVTSKDCGTGWHCSLHPLDPKGICFKTPDAGM